MSVYIFVLPVLECPIGVGRVAAHSSGTGAFTHMDKRDVYRISRILRKRTPRTQEESPVRPLRYMPSCV